MWLVLSFRIGFRLPPSCTNLLSIFFFLTPPTQKKKKKIEKEKEMPKMKKFTILLCKFDSFCSNMFAMKYKIYCEMESYALF